MERNKLIDYHQILIARYNNDNISTNERELLSKIISEITDIVSNKDVSPKKLIRSLITDKLKVGEWEEINDLQELNKLYNLKVREEMLEIKQSNHTDIMEFVDLIQVAFSYAKVNGFSHEQLSIALIEKSSSKGVFGKLVLNNLNPSNPSNSLYFE